MGIIARQATINTLLTYLGIGLGFINVVLLYPKVLSSEEFGLTRLLVSMTTMAAQVALLGMENTILRYFPYFRDPLRKHKGLLYMLLGYATAVGLLASLLLLLLHPWLSDVFSDRNALFGRYGMLLAPMVLSEVFFILLRSYSRSVDRNVQPVFIREFLLRVLQTALILVQAFRPMPFRSFLIIYVGIFLICTLVLVADLYRSGQWRLGSGERWLPRRLRRSMIAYSIFTLSASLAGIVLGNIDQLMIGALLGDGIKYVAYYAVAFYFGSVIAAPGRALNHTLVPRIAEAWKRKDLASIARIYTKGAFLQLLVSGFLFLVVFLSAEDFFRLLPPEYAGGIPVVHVVSGAYLVNSVLALNWGIINMSRAYRLDAWTSIVMLVVNAVANFILIRSMGIVGAAWATFISLVGVLLYRTWFLYKKYGLWPFDHRIVVIGAVIAGIAILLPWVPFTGLVWPDLFLRTGVIAVFFWSVPFALGYLKEVSEWLPAPFNMWFKRQQG